ncbi:hypothetical protein UO65_0810 [Actinokineospora spheciospongiae]|uniref:Uncharacterized protein n=1 Tax=Actinokineospora spheciospongiae TaxID=909613 RepID=W7J4C3_9PSEU|nr:hypothetical protein UO65_0810 [Actinokineospora spheciospongiae]
MPHHRSRLHTERLPHPRKRHHHREQHRLHHVDAFQRFPSAQDVRHREVDELRKRFLALRHRSGEHRRGIQQLPPHRNPLRALTREHEDNAVPRLGGGDLHGVVTGPHHGTEREHRPVGQRPRHVRRVGGGAAQGSGPLVRGGLGGAGDRPRRHRAQRPGGDLRPLLRFRVLRGLLDDDVGVGAGDAERRHRRPARPVRLRPRLGLGEQPHRPRRPVDVGGRLVDVQGLGQHPVAQGHDHLDDAADPGGGLGVPDVGLERAQPQRALRGPVAAVGGQDGLGLDGVAERGAGAVRLDGVDVGGGQARVGQRLADDPLLRRPVGGGEPVGGAVLVDRRAPDDGQHAVPVAAGVGQPFQQDDASALGEPGAVGGLGERLAPAVGGEPALTADLDERPRGAHHGDPAGQGHPALALAQGGDRQVQRHQRRRARGVHGDRRTLQAQGVGDPAGDDAAGPAGAQEPLDALGDRGQPGDVVVVVHQPGEHADAAGAQPRRVDARPLERLPGHLQQQPLLRVHRQRLARGDAEETRVEPGDVVEEPRLAGVAGAGGGRVRVVEPFQVPAPVGGERADAVAALGDHPPQVLRRGHPAGVAAGHADHGDRLVRPLLLLPQALAGLVQVGGDLLEEVAELLLVGARLVRVGHRGRSPRVALGGRAGRSR